MIEKVIVIAVLASLFFAFTVLCNITKDHPKCLLSTDPVLCVEIAKNKDK